MTRLAFLRWASISYLTEIDGCNWRHATIVRTSSVACCVVCLKAWAEQTSASCLSVFLNVVVLAAMLGSVLIAQGQQVSFCAFHEYILVLATTTSPEVLLGRKVTRFLLPNHIDLFLKTQHPALHSRHAWRNEHLKKGAPAGRWSSRGAAFHDTARGVCGSQ